METVERAYELALSGQFANIRQIVDKLRAEGHQTPLSDLRSRILKRELLAHCRSDSRRSTGPTDRDGMSAPDAGRL